MQRIYDKCRRREPLSREEAYRLYDQAPLQELALVADEVRRAMVPDPEVVTWQIDRNVNITNVCISGCRFCNFHCKPHQTDRAFFTTLAEYREKIDRTLELGGDQLLLQGGLHPQLRIDFYERLFSDLKALYPTPVSYTHLVHDDHLHTANALNGDRVEVVVMHRGRDGKMEGEITRIVERSRKPYVGIAEVGAHQIFVRADSRRMPMDIYLSKRLYPDVKDGEKVVVRIADWAEGSKSPVGELIERLGMAGNNDTEMHAILRCV